MNFFNFDKLKDNLIAYKSITTDKFRPNLYDTREPVSYVHIQNNVLGLYFGMKDSHCT